MTEKTGENLRAIIRLIPPARALKKELSKMVQMELADGIGEMALRNFKGLLESVTKLVDDPYPATLSPELPESAEDKQKVAAVLLALSQLIAYLEGQAGIAGRDEEAKVTGGDHVVLTFNAPLGVGFEKMAKGFAKAFGGEKGLKFAEMFREAFKGEKKEEKSKEE